MRKDIREAAEGHAKAQEKQGFLNRLGIEGHRRQHKRGGDTVEGTLRLGGIQLNKTQAQERQFKRGGQEAYAGDSSAESLKEITLGERQSDSTDARERTPDRQNKVILSTLDRDTQTLGGREQGCTVLGGFADTGSGWLWHRDIKHDGVTR